MFNNWSLVYLRLAPLTGDPTHYHKATELLEKSAKMSPADPLLTSNLASLQLSDLFATHLDMSNT